MQSREAQMSSSQCVSPTESHSLVRLGFIEGSYFQHALESNAPRPGEHMLLPAWTLSDLIKHTEVTDDQCVEVMRADRPVDAIANILINKLVDSKKVELEEIAELLKETPDGGGTT